MALAMCFGSSVPLWVLVIKWEIKSTICWLAAVSLTSQMLKLRHSAVLKTIMERLPDSTIFNQCISLISWVELITMAAASRFVDTCCCPWRLQRTSPAWVWGRQYIYASLNTTLAKYSREFSEWISKISRADLVTLWPFTYAAFSQI